MAIDATVVKDVITASVAVLGLGLGIVNYRKGLEREDLEIVIEEFEDEQNYPSLRIVVINQGNTNLTLRAIAVEHKTIQYDKEDAPQTYLIHNIFKEPEPITLKPQEARTFDTEDNRYPSGVKVIVHTTRGEEYTRLYQHNHLVWMLGINVANAVYGALGGAGITNEAERRLVRSQVLEHFDKRVKGEKIHDPGTIVGPFSEEATQFLINQDGAVIDHYVIDGVTYFKAVDRIVENTKDYLHECDLKRETIKAKRKLTARITRTKRLKTKENKSVKKAIERYREDWNKQFEKPKPAEDQIDQLRF